MDSLHFIDDQLNDLDGEVGIGKLELGPTDILVLRWESVIPDNIIRDLQTSLPWNNLIIMLPKGVEFERLSPEVLQLMIEDLKKSKDAKMPSAVMDGSTKNYPKRQSQDS